MNRRGENRSDSHRVWLAMVRSDKAPALAPPTPNGSTKEDEEKLEMVVIRIREPNPC